MSHILTERQQEVVRLYYRESLQQHEIASLLGVSQQAVHDSLRRARKTVGEKILHEGRTAPTRRRPGRPHRRRPGDPDAQLRRHRARQGQQADPEADLRNPLGGGADLGRA
ncbi:MAG: sigma factor-like helix-turn-helix DNA-binding protein, partial [Planctomycetota bacterium]